MLARSFQVNRYGMGFGIADIPRVLSDHAK